MSQSQKPHADFDFAWVVRFLGVEHRLLADHEEQAVGPGSLLEERMKKVRARFAEQLGNGDVVDVASRIDVPEPALQDLTEREDAMLQRIAAVAHVCHLPSSLAAEAAKSAWVINPT